MSDHEHAWRYDGRYQRCECGATGWRNRQGVVLAHKEPRPLPSPAPTVQIGDGDVIPCGNRWLGRKEGAE